MLSLLLSDVLDIGRLGICFSVFHGSELSLIFGPVPTSVEDDFANQLTDFYINFINDLNPGGEHKSSIVYACQAQPGFRTLATIYPGNKTGATTQTRQYHCNTRQSAFFPPQSETFGFLTHYAIRLQLSSSKRLTFWIAQKYLLRCRSELFGRYLS